MKNLFLFISLFFLANSQTFQKQNDLIKDYPSDFTFSFSTADVNKDGFLDIISKSDLFINNYGLSYVNKRLESQLPNDRMYGIFGIVFGDYNNDGYLDAFMELFPNENEVDTNIIYSKIYGNNKSLVFTESQFPRTAFASQGSAWGDINNDGYLDLFIGNEFGNDQLYKNVNGDSFTDITSAAGLDLEKDHSYGVSFSDFDNDGDLDLVVAPCSPARELSVKNLYLNNGDETFTNINQSSGVNDDLASWSVGWLDYNNDGFFDIYISNMPMEGRSGKNKLYRNNGNLTFTDVAEEVGVAGTDSGASFSVSIADFNNDGWVDIYVADINEKDAFYINQNGQSFINKIDEMEVVVNGKLAIAAADLNNDGWLDLITDDAGLSLYHNVPGMHNWVKFNLRGVSSNYYGVGARIECYAGDLFQVAEIRAGDSFCGQNDQMRAHFGLAQNEKIDSVIVRWPSGTVDIIKPSQVGEIYTVIEGLGLNENSSPSLSFSYFAKPVLKNKIDVIINSDILLNQIPTIEMIVNEEATNLSVKKIDHQAKTFKSTINLSGFGQYNFRITGRSINDKITETEKSIEFVEVTESTNVIGNSKQDILITSDENTYLEKGFIGISRDQNGLSIVSNTTIKKPVLLTWKLIDQLSKKQVIFQSRNDEWVPLETYRDRNSNSLLARINNFGQFKIDFNENENIMLPEKTELEQNLPNPFNPITVIPFSIDQNAAVKLIIYNALGQKVKVLIDKYMLIGKHHASWNGENERGAIVSTGIYFYSLQYQNKSFTKKMVFIK